MTVALVKYDAACRAIAAAKATDEVREIRNQAVAMEAYARQAKNRDLALDAAAIRLRAERRLGQLIAAQRETVGLNTGARGIGKSVGPDKTRTPTLADAGIDKNLADRARKIAAVPDDEFEGLLDNWRERTEKENQRVITSMLKAGKKETRRRDKEKRKATTPTSLPTIEGRYRLIHSDLETAEIEPESVDCIITDPPYPQEFIACYGALSRKAMEWLKPGGSLLAMAGQSHLPDVLQQLTSGGLAYHWTLAYLTPGGQAVQIFQRHVNTFWKPVFWLVKGEYAGDWIGDVARSKTNDNDKRFHEWGQSESGMADLVERFTDPGHMVCDPFMGGGTTGVVALAMDRLFIGIDKDKKAFATARQRIGASGGRASKVA